LALYGSGFLRLFTFSQAFLGPSRRGRLAQHSSGNCLSLRDRQQLISGISLHVWLRKKQEWGALMKENVKAWSYERG